MFCRHCGKENKDEAVICVGCGCPIGSGKVKKKSDSNGDSLKAIAGILGLVLGLLCIFKGIYWAYNISRINLVVIADMLLGIYFILQFVLSIKRQDIKSK